MNLMIRMCMRQLSTPCRVTTPHNFPIKNLKKKEEKPLTKSSYYYMYRALINYKNMAKIRK